MDTTLTRTKAQICGVTRDYSEVIIAVKQVIIM